MPRFFLETITMPKAVITGDDARRIAKRLRMRPGREITVCDARGTDYLCRIVDVARGSVELDVLRGMPCPNESPVFVRLYQALPRAYKLELVVQKAVELGVNEIVPVLTTRCISRPSARAMEKQRVILQRIAHDTARQSDRGVVPQVLPTVELGQAVTEMASFDLPVMLCEDAGPSLRDVLRSDISTAALLTGSEGGFSGEEIACARAAGVQITNLGGRVLRCETTPVCALSLLYFTLGGF